MNKQEEWQHTREWLKTLATEAKETTPSVDRDAIRVASIHVFQNEVGKIVCSVSCPDCPMGPEHGEYCCTTHLGGDLVCIFLREVSTTDHYLARVRCANTPETMKAIAFGEEDISVPAHACYICKVCSTPIETAIEGEPICQECWSIQQLDADGRAREATKEDDALPCPVCGKASHPASYPTASGMVVMICPDCGVWTPDLNALHRAAQVAASI